MSSHSKPFRSVQGWIDCNVPRKKARVRDVTPNGDLAPKILGDTRSATGC